MGSMDSTLSMVPKRICHVCGQLYDTNDLVVSKDLKSLKPGKNILGWGLCPKHQSLFDKGYAALVVTKNDNSGEDNRQLSNVDVERTGQVVHLRRDTLRILLPKRDIADDFIMAFVTQEFIDDLTNHMEQINAVNK